MVSMAKRDYQHSRILDVHRWSDHPETNSFVNHVYERYLGPVPGESKKIQKKHLKVVLLDLYVAWQTDPALNIAVHMSPTAYSDGTVSLSGKTRYNALNIKVSIIPIIHRLENAGLIGIKLGWRDEDGRGFLTRIWPKPKLIKLFEPALFGYFDISNPANRETVILRNEEKRLEVYDDTENTIEMHKLLQRYNALLHRTFIDIPKLDKPRIELPEKRKRKRRKVPVYVNISHHDKFVRRIFNNGTFADGGRFYGGWWQRIDGDHREGIFIDDSPTVEIDYSSLHAILAYAEAGIDYWAKTDEDPYDLPVRGVNNPEHTRSIVKLFMLLSFNASDEPSLFKAFRSELDYKKYPYSFPDNVLTELLSAVRERHGRIANLICSGAGLRLMNIDSHICAHIIRGFLEEDIPILTVHDSFIVPFRQEDRLNQLMREAFAEITSSRNIKVKYNRNLTKRQLYAHGAQDRNWLLDMIASMKSPHKSDGYKLRLRKHKAWLDASED